MIHVRCVAHLLRHIVLREQECRRKITIFLYFPHQSSSSFPPPSLVLVRFSQFVEFPFSVTLRYHSFSPVRCVPLSPHSCTPMNPRSLSSLHSHRRSSDSKSSTQWELLSCKHRAFHDIVVGVDFRFALERGEELSSSQNASKVERRQTFSPPTHTLSLFPTRNRREWDEHEKSISEDKNKMPKRASR